MSSLLHHDACRSDQLAVGIDLEGVFAGVEGLVAVPVHLDRQFLTAVLSQFADGVGDLRSVVVESARLGVGQNLLAGLEDADVDSLFARLGRDVGTDGEGDGELRGRFERRGLLVTFVASLGAEVGGGQM